MVTAGNQLLEFKIWFDLEKRPYKGHRTACLSRNWFHYFRGMPRLVVIFSKLSDSHDWHVSANKECFLRDQNQRRSVSGHVAMLNKQELWKSISIKIDQTESYVLTDRSSNQTWSLLRSLCHMYINTSRKGEKKWREHIDTSSIRRHLH
jgi:hypothetical protein